MSSTVDSARQASAEPNGARTPPLVELDAPAAVLLVDLHARTVVHANDVAEQLAPGVGLPAAVDAWSDAAGLLDADGAELSDTDHPLSRLAGGRPVQGQAVTAGRRSSLGTRRAPLWVVGIPLSGQPLDGFGLVVLLPLRRREEAAAVAQAYDAGAAVDDVDAAEVAAVVASEHTTLRERALVATGVTFTIADARDGDHPLLWVNPAFTTVTGYSFDDAVGRNCRFLQGPGTDPASIRQLHDALAAGLPVSTTLLNYRKDGSAFWNLVAISPVHDDSGTLTHFVGIQSDVTARVTADAERDRALAAEQAARADAVRAQAQLGLLAEASGRLATALAPEESLEVLLDLAVPTLCDWAMVTTFDENGGFGRIVARHVEGRAAEMSELVSRVREGLSPAAPMFQHYRGAPGWRVDGYASSSRRQGYVTDAGLLDVSAALGLESVMFVPLPGRRQVIGSVVLARGGDREPFTDQDLRVAEDLGRRAGVALDNVRLYQAEHRIAETLQRSLLPEIPDVEGLHIVGRYRAGEAFADVGGDFYDVIRLPDGRVGVSVGDVVGHDLAAAAAMGHLRGLLRACAWENGEAGHDPADVVRRLDRIVQGLQTVPMATLVYATLTPPTTHGAAWRLDWSTAGHPPMLLRHADGDVEVLEGAAGLLLGVEATTHSSATAWAEPGSLLLAYTDGLVERRDREITEGLSRVRDVLAAARPDRPGTLCDLLLAENPTDDDTAVLAIHIT